MQRSSVWKRSLIVGFIFVLLVGALPAWGAPPSQDSLPPRDPITAGNADQITELMVLDHAHEGEVYSLAFDRELPILYTGSYDGNIRAWDVDQGVFMNMLRGHDYGVYSLATSPTQNLLLSGGWDGTVRLWDTFNGTPLVDLREHREPVYGVAWAPDGEHFASAGGYQVNAVYFWDMQYQYAVFKNNAGWVESVAFSPAGDWVASAGDEGKIHLWNNSTGEHVVQTGHEWAIGCVVFSPDGSRLASASLDGTVRIWDYQNAQQVLRLDTGPVWKIAYSPDGSLLAAGGRGGEITLWDAAAGTQLATIPAHDGWIEDVKFNADGTILATAGDDGTVRLWGVPQGDWDEPVVVVATPLDAVQLHMERGIRYYHEMNYWDAVDEFEAALGLNPDYAEAYYWLGKAEYARYSNYAGAILNFGKAIKLDPTNALYYVDRGVV